jgi:hypothetical protein
MKTYLFRLTSTISLGVVLTIIFGISESTLAQYKAPENDGYQSNEQDPLYGTGGTNFNPLELIHRANLNNGRSIEEFNTESEANIQNSADEFKRLQQERILQYEQKPSNTESDGVNRN